MKLQTKLKPQTLKAPKPLKIKGHTTIILTDKDGREERHEDDNMLTNAISDYFANCGFLNFPDLDKSNMVQLLLGGVMCFDTAITESATQVHTPAGVKMTAHGAVGYSNTSGTELGSYISDESGWQDDGSFLQTYEFTTGQGNGTIASVCLTGQVNGYAGEGNAQSEVARDSKVGLTLGGSATTYTIAGYPCRVSIADATAYGVSLEDITNGNIIIRKYRIPTTKVNIKGTVASPIVLEEKTITAPSAFVDYITGEHGNVGLQRGSDSMGSVTEFDGKLYWFSFNHYYSTGSRRYWDSGYTQYLFTIDPVAGTVTSEVLANTSGETLDGVCMPVFFSDSLFCFINGSISMNTSYYRFSDSTKIIRVEKVGGVWVMDAIPNPYGYFDQGGAGGVGWGFVLSKTESRVLLNASSSVANLTNAFIYDDNLRTIFPANLWNAVSVSRTETDKPLITHSMASGAVTLYRDMRYIATINNLAEPVVKTAEKAMKIIYRLTFEEGEENA